MTPKKQIFDIDLSQYPESLKQPITDLSNEHGKERIRARETLVAIGPLVLDYIYPLLQSENRVLRWEAAKITEEIAHLSSLSVLLDLLEDEDHDIRWIAAEGIVDLGAETTIHLLDRLMRHDHSKYLVDEAHHVIGKMYHGEDRVIYQPLLDVLKSKHKGDLVSFEALQLLRLFREG